MGWRRRDSGTGSPARASISGSRPLALSAALDTVLQSSGSEVALVEVASDGDNRTLTFAELRRASIGFSGRLRSLGIGRGDVVGVWLPNCLEWFVAQFAIARLGAVVLPVNTRYGAHDVADLMFIARPRLLLLPSSFNEIDFRGKFRHALLTEGPSQWGAPVVGIVGPVHNDELDDWDVGSRPVPLGTALEMSKAEAGNTNEPGTNELGRPEDVVNLFATSGSTGRPKLAAHSQESILGHALDVGRALDVRAADRVVCVLPLCGVFGFSAAISALFSGATCILYPKFDAGQVLQDMGRMSVTHVYGGDDLFTKLMDAYAREPVSISSWRRGGVADFIGKAGRVVEWAEESFGAHLAGVYGSSECHALMATWPSSLIARERARSGGELVCPEAEVRVVGAAGAAYDEDSAYDEDVPTTRTVPTTGWQQTVRRGSRPGCADRDSSASCSSGASTL